MNIGEYMRGKPLEPHEAELLRQHGMRVAAIEPIRPPLPGWGESKPFDPFEGYEVTRSTNEQQACKSPLTTLGDGTDPAHGSAFLKPAPDR